MRLKMRRNRMRAHQPLALSAAAAALLMGCGGSSDAALPQLSAATPATLQSCTTLATSLALPDTRITSAEQVPAGPITVQGVAVFGEKDLVDLTLTIATMNAINRMGVSFRMKPRAKA